MSPTAKPAITSGKTQVLGSITVIDTPLVTRAMDYARTHSEPFLFNHAVRSWLFAVRLGQLQGIAHDAEVVAVGSLLHDLGLTNSFTGQKRFEIEGADAARAFGAGAKPRRSPRAVDLGQRRSEFHTFDRPAQGGGSRALHGWDRPRIRIPVRPDPAERNEEHPRRISPSRHEAALQGFSLPHCQDQAGDHLRQFRGRLRGTFCPRLQAAVYGGFPDGCSVRGVGGV